MEGPVSQEFDSFFARTEPQLRHALFAMLGVDRGREATAEALAWAWENWSKVRELENAVGYLVRVGQSRTRRKRFRPVFIVPTTEETVVEPRLGEALGRLSESQRVAVVLVHGFGWTLREVAELRGVQVTSVQTHLERGLRRLRDVLGVDEHA
jgi:DNA-directed RNA polymerase specialized sigma24 family protein